MNEYGLTAENILNGLPDILAQSPKMKYLAEAIVKALEKQALATDFAKIYINIDKLPEQLLDALAYDFKVDWYSYDAGIDTKRIQLKNNFQVHRHLGTKSAVINEVTAFFPGANVYEWFEYNGQPYHFKVEIPYSEVDTSTDPNLTIATIYRKIWERVLYSKSYRSVLDVIDYYDTNEDTVLHTGALPVGGEIVDACLTMMEKPPTTYHLIDEEENAIIFGGVRLIIGPPRVVRHDIPIPDHNHNAERSLD